LAPPPACARRAGLAAAVEGQHRQQRAAHHRHAQPRDQAAPAVLVRHLAHGALREAVDEVQ
jgi:hypothetical protein